MAGTVNGLGGVPSGGVCFCAKAGTVPIKKAARTRMLILLVVVFICVLPFYWFFAGALTDVEYAITVTDTATGNLRSYFNPGGVLASLADTAAFAP